MADRMTTREATRALVSRINAEAIEDGRSYPRLLIDSEIVFTEKQAIAMVDHDAIKRGIADIVQRAVTFVQADNRKEDET